MIKLIVSTALLIILSQAAHAEDLNIANLCPQQVESTTLCTMQYDPHCATLNNDLSGIKAPRPSAEKQEFSNICKLCYNPIRQRITKIIKGQCEQ